MPGLTKAQDAYGQMLYDFHLGQDGFEVDERDDGLVGITPVSGYFAEYGAWPERQKAGIRLARGRILDVGCGAGRVALHLQQNGFDAMGIDVSPLAIRVCKLRGLKKAKVMSVTQLSRKVGVFDTVVMYGNNFGLFGNARRARWLLQRLRGITSKDGRIIAETFDPYQTDERCHLSYQKLNKRRGRMPGQIRLRVRYKTYATPWFDYLFVSKTEMERLLAGTGWRAMRFIDSPESPRYVAIIEKSLGRQL